MSVKAKQRRIEKKRAESAAKRLADSQEWEKIKSITTTFSIGRPAVKAKRWIDYGPIIVRAREELVINSVRTTESCTGPSIERPRYEGEMLEREQSAMEEIERKKKRVGITVNKGAYQYLTPGMDPKTLGKK